ncbi:MAG: GNAT family N-acetyltransferase [Deltaproteobacteria bacterium]|nr:GNAT family N-acetyltransferase [Deltaproteobacteria bacterium]
MPDVAHIISLATSEDVAPIAALLRRCMLKMRADGSDQWSEAYPTAEVVVGDVAAGTLFSLRTSPRAPIVAVITCDENVPPEYEPIAFTRGRPLVVHRLAVDPEQQGRGYARMLMQFAERRARELGCTTIRFDTYSRNVAAVGLYLQLGYVQLPGEIRFPGRAAHFYCFEKLLDR